MPASGRDACPGCGMRHAPLDGPTHRYIGASPACWALFAPLTVGDVPDAALLADTRVPPEIAVPSSRADPTLGVLLVDAYAAQHAGVPSPQAATATRRRRACGGRGAGSTSPARRRGPAR